MAVKTFFKAVLDTASKESVIKKVLVYFMHVVYIAQLSNARHQTMALSNCASGAQTKVTIARTNTLHATRTQPLLFPICGLCLDNEIVQVAVGLHLGLDLFTSAASRMLL